jgi:hypothetical protein
MTAPSSYVTFDIQAFIDEAYRRARVPVEELNATHNQEARTSLVFLLSSWAARGNNKWLVQREEQLLTDGMVSFTVPTDLIDVGTVQYYWASTGVYQPMVSLTGPQYQNLTNKDIKSPSTSWWYNYSERKIYLYPIGDSATNKIVYWYIKRTPDLFKGQHEWDALPYEWWDALVWELAHRVGFKIPQVEASWLSILKAEAKDALNIAEASEFDEGTVFIGPC